MGNNTGLRHWLAINQQVVGSWDSQYWENGVRWHRTDFSLALLVHVNMCQIVIPTPELNMN